MTEVLNASRSPSITLTADVIDAVSEAVAAPPTPAARAAVIAALMTEMYSTVQWRLGATESDHELASLRQVLTEAEAHLTRMPGYR